MELSGGPLQNRFVRLDPFDAAEHGSSLRAMARDLGDSIDTWPYYNPPHDWVGFWLDNIATRQQAGTIIPYAVIANDGRFAGMTSFLDMNAASRTVEIGMTIYGANFQGGATNPACKHLLMGHAFDRGAVRIQLNVDERNKRSQAAVLKLGATQEGILRDNRILANGRLRSTVVFSVLAREWPAVKERLEQRLTAFG